MSATTSGATRRRWAYFDEQGRPTRHKDGYARVTPSTTSRQSDRAGLFRRARPAPRHKDGYAAWKARYDERGNRIEMTTLDVDGKPVLLTSDGTVTPGSVRRPRQLHRDGLLSARAASRPGSRTATLPGRRATTIGVTKLKSPISVRTASRRGTRTATPRGPQLRRAG